MTDPPGYRLDLRASTIDAIEFEAALDEARVQHRLGESERAIDALDRGLGLWRGDAYAGFEDEEWAMADAQRLEDLRLGAEEVRGEALVSAGRYREAIAGLHALFGQLPLRGSAASVLMISLYRSDRQTEALRVAKDHWDALVDAGLEPTPDLVDLEQRVAAHDVSLRARPESGPHHEQPLAPRCQSGYVRAEPERCTARKWLWIRHLMVVSPSIHSSACACRVAGTIRIKGDLMERRALSQALLFAGLTLALLLPGSAVQAHPDQHGPSDGHLLGQGAEGDLALLSQLRLSDIPETIADVAVSPDGNYAYLANWGQPDCDANSEAGGVNDPDAGIYVVDIRDLEDPALIGFIPHHQDSRPGEGVQVLDVDTSFFSGTMLVTNNEQCGSQGKGGVTLTDVTNPAKPKRLSSNFGDRGDPALAPAGFPPSDTHEIHSAFAWDVGDKAYVVIVDNFEFPDVDILDITNPRRPRLIAEYDLNQHDVDQPEIGLTSSFIHDIVVKQIDGVWTMLVSYWDGGYVLLDVDDPADAQFLGDTDFEAIDPLLFERTGTALPPEGNAHQAEFTADDRFFIGTDEDFAPYAVGAFTIATGPNAGTYPSVAVGGAEPVTALPDQRLNGPTVYVGYACPGSAAVPPADSVGAPALQPGEELIAVIQRGPVEDPGAPEDACFPGEKADIAIAAGYDAVVFVNHHAGEAASPTSPFCGSGAFTQPVVAVCTTHDAFHKLFDSTTGEYPEPNPVLGQVGHYVDVDAIFDGWGYVHLFDANTLADLDQFAVPEAHDEAFALGFGDLSVHEVATHPTEWDQAYLSYYSAGLRSLEIQCTDETDTSTCELVETGRYLDENGNNFWGVEVFIRDGRTIILGSDRDHGLWIFEDTELAPE